MIHCTGWIRLSGAAAAALLTMLGGGCMEMGSTGPSVTALNYDTHTGFPIASGAHERADCDTCHGDFNTFQQFTCVTCHEHAQEATDPIHVGVAAYSWSATSCFECHPDGQASAVDHTQLFPIGPGTTHAGISCATCHVDATNRKVVDCLTCHTATSTDPRHGTVGGYTRSSALCVRCHGDSQVNLVLTHLPFSIRLGTKHYRTSCLTCHPASRTDKPWAQDFTLFDCLSCHDQPETDSHHQGRAGYQYVSTTCVNSGCHQNGRNP